jgi:tetratricopeptide (TPR) repeat protein
MSPALSIVALLGLVLPPVPVPAQRGPGQEDWIQTVVPRMDSAAAQLGHARRLKRQMLEKEGDELAFWRRLAVEAYQAVRVFHGGARAACTEASFRAGEILRAGGDEAGALVEFRWAVQHGEAGAFRTRAGLEIGHLHRRAERWREALEAYADAAADPVSSAARREDAWLWSGVSWKALGRTEDARQVWKRVAEQGTDALARIRAFDELGLLLLEAGDLEGAAGMLDRALASLSSRALEETEEGERVRNALLGMRLVDALQRAIARRRTRDVEQGTAGKS